MAPQDIFNKFANRVFQLSLLQRATRTLIGDQIRSFVKIKETGGEFTSVHNFIYYEPSNGGLKCLTPRTADVDQALAECRFHKIKQYQWILAEAYEGFEDFLEEAYAAAAMRKPSVWWMADYGNITPGEVDETDFEWLLDRARRKKDRPYSITERFRASSEDFKKFECGNERGANYRVGLVVIEKLRHIIVHNNGYIDDIESVVSKSVGQAGKDGRFKVSMREIFDTYCELHDGRNLISLLEVSVGADDALYRLNAVNNTLDELLRVLVEYAALITNTVEKFARPA